MIGLLVTTIHVQLCSSVWVLLNCPGFYYSVQCTCTHVLLCTFHFPKFYRAQRGAPSESCINLWSTRIAGQQSENTAAAQPLLIGIKRRIPKQFSIKLWLWQTCQTNCQHAALSVEGRKTEAWRQEVSRSTCSFRHGAWNEVFFLFGFFTLDLFEA